MAQVIRLSPSGPPVRGDGGGLAEPGAGFQLRLDEDQGSSAVTQLTEEFVTLVKSGGEEVYKVELDNPTPQKRYKVNSRVQVFSTTSSDSTEVTLRLMVAYNEGTPQMIAMNNWQLPPSAAVSAGIDLAMTLGSELDSPIPAGASKMEVTLQAKIGANATASVLPGGNEGTVWLSLAELL